MGKKGTSKYFGKFIEGQKFGKYTIINGNIELNREAQILCLCECGVENYVSCWTLLNGKSKGCLKCNNPRPGETNPLWGGFKNISGKYYGRIKRNAIKRNIIFDITIEYINQVLVEQDFKCNLSKIPIYFSGSKIDNYEATASIDRIDSDKGYIVGNIQWIHKDINLMKNHFNQNYFLDICEKITNERKRKETP
jgi:hypothetical protein